MLRTFAKVIVGLGLFSNVSLADTLKCVNYFNINGVDRAVFFEGEIKAHDHIPDSLFILDDQNASIVVKDFDRENVTTVFESDDLELIYAKSLREVLSHQAGEESYALDFDRQNATMMIRYVKGSTYIESSIDTSLCDAER